MDRDTIQKEEKIDVTIEEIIRKINSTIMLFKEHYEKMDRSEARKEVERLEAWMKKIDEVEQIYNNEIVVFRKDINSKETRAKMKACEVRILNSIKTIIMNLNTYIQLIKTLTEDAKHGAKIVKEYNELIDVYNKYISDQKLLMSLLEEARIIEFQELEDAA